MASIHALCSRVNALATICIRLYIFYMTLSRDFALPALFGKGGSSITWSLYAYAQPGAYAATALHLGGSEVPESSFRGRSEHNICMSTKYAREGRYDGL